MQVFDISIGKFACLSMSRMLFSLIDRSVGEDIDIFEKIIKSKRPLKYLNGLTICKATSARYQAHIKSLVDEPNADQIFTLIYLKFLEGKLYKLDAHRAIDPDDQKLHAENSLIIIGDVQNAATHYTHRNANLKPHAIGEFYILAATCGIIMADTAAHFFENKKTAKKHLMHARELVETGITGIEDAINTDRDKQADCLEAFINLQLTITNKQNALVNHSAYEAHNYGELQVHF